MTSRNYEFKNFIWFAAPYRLSTTESILNMLAQDIEEEEEELLPEVVTAALKLVRKFAQKNCSEKDVLSLRNIEREITVKKINNVKQTSIIQFYN